MRFGLTVLALAACAAWAGPASAQDTPASKEADLGRHLLVASEAKLAEGKALIAQGKLEQGLRALREIPVLLARHEALVRGSTTKPSAGPARVKAGPGLRAEPAPARPAPMPEPSPAAAGTPGAAVDAALAWLARHQGDDGAWRSKSFTLQCAKTGCGGAAAADDHTVGVTGLAILAFLGRGHTHKAGEYQAQVRNGLHYLQSVQAENGCIGGRDEGGHYIYSHAVATMALAEAYGMTRTPSFKVSAEKARDYLLGAQNPFLGWRYGIRPGDNDSSVTTWAVMALKSVKVAGLRVPDSAFAGARNWFDKVTDTAFYKTGYVQKGDNGARMADAQQYQPTEAMTAAALTCRRLMGQSADDPVCKGGAVLLMNQPPKWEPKTGNDYYYWYFGTLACYQQGGKAWRWCATSGASAMRPARGTPSRPGARRAAGSTPPPSTASRCRSTTGRPRRSSGIHH
ncbi:MAG: hypothetical protein ACYTGX_18800 [Planctomycetota bacterium]|jgi:hypothetical protein